MRKLTTEKRIAILGALVEGCSINSTARMCGVSKLTILRLLADVGSLCCDYHDLMVRGLHSQRVQVDEIWSFVGCKARTKAAGGYGHGDAWTWVAMDADAKLVVSYLVGNRDATCANTFMLDVAERINTRVQLTSDAHGTYLNAVENAFGSEVDYAMLLKLYGPDTSGDGPERKYSPGKCNGTRKLVQFGMPDKKHVSTSFIERLNLTLRMGNRRHTRLTNAFSKKLANHAHAIALHYFHYNFIRKHLTLGTTPAVAAGVADHEWTIADLVRLLEDEERKVANGGRINRADRS
ncbi:MAG: IS1 family transposase [Phycisphaerae bacterium]